MELKNRDEINEIYKWRMEDVYETENLWEKDIENVETQNGGGVVEVGQSEEEQKRSIKRP